MTKPAKKKPTKKPARKTPPKKAAPKIQAEPTPTPQPTHEPERRLTATEARQPEEPTGLALLLAEKVRYTPVGLIIDEAATLEECGQIYQFQSAMSERSNWMLGDTIKHMSQRFPETYAQFVHITGKQYSTLTTIASVCDRIPMDRRHEALPFSYHTEVAYLPPAIADEILEKAEKEDWNTRDVREAVARAQGKTPRTEAGKARAQELAPKPPEPTPHHQPVIEIEAQVQPATDTKPETAHVEIRLLPTPETVLPTTAIQPAAPSIPQPNEFEDSLARFVSSIERFNTDELKPLALKRLLHLLYPVDELIQKLLDQQKKQTT